MAKVVTVYIIIISGYLGWNDTLFVVGARRQWEDVRVSISHQVKLSDYECAVGLPYGFGHLIGKEVFFRDNAGHLFGPWIVTDVEQHQHYPYMRDNELAADVLCFRPIFDKMVHQRGEIVLKHNRRETRY